MKTRINDCRVHRTLLLLTTICWLAEGRLAGGADNTTNTVGMAAAEQGRNSATASIQKGEDRFPTAEESLGRLSTLDDKHRLAIGDKLSFRIFEDEEEPRVLSVTDSGDLELPYLGRFSAEGKSCRQLATEVKAALEKEYYYQATVVVAVDAMAKTRGRVYLVGPVRAPGPQEIPSDEVLTLSKAILRAGGFNDFADSKNVRVTRKGTGKDGQEQQMTVNVAEILNKGKTATDLPLEPGDLIYVPERVVRF